jgi:hypothetical protein
MTRIATDRRRGRHQRDKFVTGEFGGRGSKRLVDSSRISFPQIELSFSTSSDFPTVSFDWEMLALCVG